MANGQQMQAKLVRSSSLWKKPESRNRRAICAEETVDDLVMRNTRAPMFVIDLLSGSPLEIFANGQVYRARKAHWMPRNDGAVTLVDRALFELFRKRAVSLAVACHHDESTRVAVETVHNACSRKLRCDAHSKAVGLFRSDPWNREKSARFVEHNEPRITVDYLVTYLRFFTHSHIVP